MALSGVAELGSVRRSGQTYVALAALAWSSAGLVQRELPLDAATQVAGRALFAAPALFAYAFWVERRDVLRAFARMGLAGVAVGVLVGVASSTFIVALNHTSVANVLFLQALAPLIAALLAWVAFHEAVSLRTAGAMVLALAGVGLMVGGPGGARGIGLALSVVMTLCFAGSVVVTRHHREVSMTPAVCLSQVLVVLAFGPFASPGSVSARDLGLLVALGVGQMGLGLAFFTVGARLIPAADVALIALLEVVLGPVWVWLALGERPASSTLIGGAVVIGAVALQSSGADPLANARPPVH